MEAVEGNKNHLTRQEADPPLPFFLWGLHLATGAYFCRCQNPVFLCKPSLKEEILKMKG